jgi:hypothetical protein
MRHTKSRNLALPVIVRINPAKVALIQTPFVATMRAARSIIAEA